jgi:hypothetical protein
MQTYEYIHEFYSILNLSTLETSTTENFVNIFFNVQ